ncbi:serine/threonine-protein kinase H1 homolog isoform X1 [Amblyomma americanum]
MGSGQAKMTQKAAALSAGSVQTVMRPGCHQRKQQGKWVKTIKISSFSSLAGSYRIDARVLAKYNVKTVISKGRFGRVLRVENKLSKQLYAVKIIETEVDSHVETELAVLRRVRHTNVVRLDEVIRVGGLVYMVMELATGGSLQDKLEVHAPFVETDAARVIHMLTCGLAQLHGLGIAHRNLEPENVLYEHPGAGAKVLITEFGLASAPTAGREACMHTVCEGKLRYMAPEMVSRRPYTHAVDMWALGVITHVLLTGVLPFDAHSDAAVVQLIMGAQLSVAPEANSSFPTSPLPERTGRRPCSDARSYLPNGPCFGAPAQRSRPTGYRNEGLRLVL